MNEELKILIRVVTDEAKRNLDTVKKSLGNIEKESDKTGKSVSQAMSSIKKSIGVAIGSIVALTTAMVALGKSAQDVQKGFEKLNTSFLKAGSTTKQATQTYKDLFAFLGDHDKAVETAQSLSLITSEEQKLAEWSQILKGAWAEMGDKLPIEGLAEAANETINTGKVVGVMADALTWAKISEDGFNAALAQTSSLEEREALVRNTLNGLYSQSADLYDANNKRTMQYNTAQANLNIALAKTAAYLTPLVTAVINLGTTMLTALAPAIEVVSVYLTAFIQLIIESIQWIGEFFGLFEKQTEETASNMEGYKSAMNQYMSDLQDYFNGSSQGIEDTENNVKKLKKQLMGFDELNVITDPNAKTSTSVTTPSLGKMPTAPNMADYGVDAGSIGKQLDDFQAKVDKAKDTLKGWLPFAGALAGILGSIKFVSWVQHLGESSKLVQKMVQCAEQLGFKWSNFDKQLGNMKFTEGLKAILGGIKSAATQLAAPFMSAFKAIGALIAKIGAWIASAAKAVVAFIGGLSAGAIALIIAIVVAVASAIYFLVKNWNELGQSVKNFFNENIAPKFAKIGETLGQLWDAIKSVGQAFADLGLLIWNAIPEEVRGWFVQVAEDIAAAWNAFISWLQNIDWAGIWQGFLTVIEWIGGFVVGVIGGVIGGAINALVGIIQGVVQFVTGVVQVVSGIVSGLVNLIVALFTGDFSKALDSCKMIVDGIVNVFKGLYNVTIGVVVNLIKGIIDWFVEMWDVLVGHSIVPDMVKAIIEWFFKLPKQIFDMIANFVKTIINYFSNLATSAGKLAVEMWNKIKAPFSNVASWFKDTFTKAWQGVKNVFSSGGTIFNGIKDGIANVFKTVVNGLITGINKVIATPFNAINSMFNKLRGISIAGIKPFDWIPSLSVPQIPKLATGGLVSSATLAMIGERGKEAVLPLENNTGWMDALADRIAARNNTPSKIVLKVGEKELGWATINSINDITKQTGGLQLHLV